MGYIRVISYNIYNPLILSFDPNFLGHPSMDTAYVRENPAPTRLHTAQNPCIFLVPETFGDEKSSQNK